MPKCYPDQNFLIDCTKDKALRALAIEAASAHVLQFVLSPVHVYEFGLAGPSNGSPLIEFAESLQPLWLMSRVDIQCAEIVRAWRRFWNAEKEEAEVTGTLTEVAAILNGRPFPPTVEVPLSFHVRDFYANGSTYMNPKHEKLAEAAQANRRATLEGRFTKGKKTGIDAAYVAQMLALVHYGIAEQSETASHIRAMLEDETLAEQIMFFVTFGGMSLLKSQKIEQLLTERFHRGLALLNRNRQNDREHAIYALPNCDFFITRDKELKNETAQIAEMVTFPVARTIDADGFRNLFR